MIHLHYNSDIDEKIAAMRSSLSNYLIKLRQVVTEGDYGQNESSINLPADSKILSDVQQLAAKKVSAQLKYHIVVGIGGSNLGAKAVYDALLGYDDVMASAQYPKLIFAETVDTEFLQVITKMIGQLESLEQILVSVISKSGGTTETIANFEIIANALVARFGEQSMQRVVAITNQDSELWQAATQKNIDCLSIPKKVGGRYSVFSAVGLFPLETVGVDTVALLQGALEMRDKCLEDGEHCAALVSACLLNYYRLQEKTINDNFIFCPRLESAGKWYRQLLAESIGKQKDVNGQDVNVGITPTVSIGSTDLHSVGQLYLGGPKDKFTTFMSVDEEAHLEVPGNRALPQILPMINQKTTQQITHAILDGVMAAYQKADLPYVHLAIDSVNARDLGMYMQLKMLEVMYLAQLMGINAFDQPSVELYKIETKNILENDM